MRQAFCRTVFVSRRAARIDTLPTALGYKNRYLNGRRGSACPSGNGDGYGVSRHRRERFSLRGDDAQKETAGAKTASAYLFLYLAGCLISDGSGNLAGAKATRADVYSAGRTVDQRFYPFHVGLPRSVGSSVGVGYLNTELYVFSAKITFCHGNAPPFTFGSSIYLELQITL